MDWETVTLKLFDMAGRLIVSQTSISNSMSVKLLFNNISGLHILNINGVAQSLVLIE